VLRVYPPRRAQQGAAQRAGEAHDNVGRNIRRGVERAFARTRASVLGQELITRVYSRIHWDKKLLKLDELIYAAKNARNELICIEHLSEDQLDRLGERYHRLAQHYQRSLMVTTGDLLTVADQQPD
jgi:Low affinity iron permease